MRAQYKGGMWQGNRKRGMIFFWGGVGFWISIEGMKWEVGVFNYLKKKIRNWKLEISLWILATDLEKVRRTPSCTF